MGAERHGAARSGALKWKDLVTPGTPLPTPWEKDEFEQESRAIQERRRAIRARNAPEAEMDALFREQRDREEKLLGVDEVRADGRRVRRRQVRGARPLSPEADCIMFTRDAVGFCRVCRRAIGRIIDLYSK